MTVLGLALAPVRNVVADEVEVPPALQVQLLDRVLRYERGYASERDPVRVLVVVRPGGAESERTGAQLRAAITHAGTLGGRPVVVTQHGFRGVARLVRRAQRREASVVYLSAGLGGEVPRLVQAMPSPGRVVVSSVGADADGGATLAFELESSRPRIVVNLASAATQQLQFSAQLLRVSRVVR